MLIVVVVSVAMTVENEVETSRQQAAWLSDVAPELHYELKPGSSPAIRFPGVGPFDERLGYHWLPDLVQHLGAQGYAVTSQAHMSPNTSGPILRARRLIRWSEGWLLSRCLRSPSHRSSLSPDRAAMVVKPSS